MNQAVKYVLKNKTTKTLFIVAVIVSLAAILAAATYKTNEKNALTESKSTHLGQPIEITVAPTGNTVVDHATQDQAPTQPPAPATHSSALNAALPDTDGCTPGTTSYQACRDAATRLAFMDQCNTDMTNVNKAYRSIYDPALSSYDADIAAQQQEVNNAISQYGYSQSWGSSVMLNYTHQRAQQYNAVVEPAYISYVTAVNAINARGCNLAKTYSDPSLPF